MNLYTTFDSRRSCRTWIERNWSNHVYFNFNADLGANAAAWAIKRNKDEPKVYHDAGRRRWWFRNKNDAIEFKLIFGV